jgi:hypothetical protein
VNAIFGQVRKQSVSAHGIQQKLSIAARFIKQNYAKNAAVEAYTNIDTFQGPFDVPNMSNLSDREGRALRKLNTIITKNIEIARLQAENTEMKRKTEKIGGTRKRKRVQIDPNSRFIDVN